MKTKTFSSLEKAIDILELFNFSKRSFSAQEISSALSMPLSSTYKYLEFLTKMEILQRLEKTKQYSLGFLILRLGNVFASDFSLIDIALPYLQALSQETGETAILTAVIRFEAICLECVEPDRLIRLSLEKGRCLPLHTGASSKILLAHQDDGYIDTYLKNNSLTAFTDKSITDAKALEEELKSIREHGYSVSDSEVDDNACAISVPLLDQGGRLIAGLTVAGPSDRFTDQTIMQFLNLLKSYVKKISKDLGWKQEN